MQFQKEGDIKPKNAGKYFFYMATRSLQYSSFYKSIKSMDKDLLLRNFVGTKMIC